MKRRQFLQAGTAAGTLLAPQTVLGANNRIRVALIGAGGRGRGVTNQAQEAGAQVVAACDVYGPRMDEAREQFGSAVKAVKDYRAILDDKEIDAVVIGTPDHWHTPMVLDALDAGKDIYCEKPVTQKLEDGDRLVKAVESSKQVVATGTQQRSWDHYLLAKQVVQEGMLGPISFVRTYWYQNYSFWHARMKERLKEVDTSKLDWDAWLGRAPKQPFDEHRFRFWRFFWDFGGGIFTDLLVHWIDVIQWYLDSPNPESLVSSGVTHVQKWMETPDTVTTTIQFPNNLTVLYHGWMAGGIHGGGIVFRGEKAMMELTRDGFSVYPEGEKPAEATGLPEPLMRVRRTSNGTRANVENWLECIHSRKTPNAFVRAGVQAARTAHLANQALRNGGSLTVES